jgi:hypothetical protein
MLLVGAMIISLERHRKLSPLTAILTGVGTLAIVLGAITTTLAVSDPVKATGVTRGVVNLPLVERVADVDLPTQR